MKYSEILSAVPYMSESHLNALIKFSTEELTRRAEKRKEARAAWVKDMYELYTMHPDTDYRCRENLTIVAVYGHYTGVRIGTAFPINGDAFDKKTGIAVAFAKAIGETIPDYI